MSQIWPGMHGVPKVGLGSVPGVHCQPAWQSCPASQIWPGMQIAERCFFAGGGAEGDGAGEGEVGGDVGIATQPVSSNARIHALMWLSLKPGSVIKRPRS